MPLHTLLHTIGNTPLLHAHRFAIEAHIPANLFVKCECFNPGGSIKDRAALSMIEAAEREGLLRPGGVIIEPTSGNTGIGLALVARQKGYRLLLTMPESMSLERRKLLASFGAELVLTSAKAGMQGAVDRAMLLAAEYPNSYIPNQFKNPANAAAHYFGTAEEIWRDTEGQVGLLVACVGSGGTITGCGARLKELKPDIHIVAVEPAESPLLSTGKSGEHGIEGIGANFIPALLDQSLIDEIITVSTADALATARRFSRSEGLGVGISSGAALAAALTLVVREEFSAQQIVVILPDGSNRYMSTPLFAGNAG